MTCDVIIQLFVTSFEALFYLTRARWRLNLEPAAWFHVIGSSHSHSSSNSSETMRLSPMSSTVPSLPQDKNICALSWFGENEKNFLAGNALFKTEMRKVLSNFENVKILLLSRSQLNLKSKVSLEFRTLNSVFSSPLKLFVKKWSLPSCIFLE